MSLAQKIKKMEIRVARKIALGSLKHLSKHLDDNFEKEAKKLLGARPTAVTLYNCVEELRQNKTKNKTKELIKKLKENPKKIAENGYRLLKGKTIMTHCHSTTVVELLKKSKPKVFVTKTDPVDQGIKTAKKLATSKIDTTLIIDSACGYYMPKCDALVVGTDAIRKEGNVNKIGTLAMSVVAKEFGKKVFVAGSTLKIDKRPEVEIEMRSPREINKSIKGVEIKNPAFDITPYKYIDKIITEQGVYSPKKIKELFK